MAAVEAQQQYEDYTVRWLEQRDARAIEPRISDETLGGIHVQGSARVDPYRFCLALAAADGKAWRLHPQGRGHRA